MINFDRVSTRSSHKLIPCLLILLVIFIMIILGILVEKLSESGTPTVTPANESSSKQKIVKFHKLRTIDLGEGIFANIVFANDHFYVSYETMGKGIFLSTYDKDFVFQEKRQLTNKEGADHQLVFDNGYFYLATSFNLKKFDLDFREIKSVAYFDRLPSEMKVKWPNGTNDMLLVVGNGSLYLGMASGNISKEDKAKKKDIADDLYLQKYNQDLELQRDWLLKDLGNTPGSSLIEEDDGFTVITSDQHWNDSSLIAVSYDQEGKQLDKKVISAVANVNEEFAMGPLFQNGIHYLAYEYISGDLSQPSIGEPIRRIDVMLKAFDQDWNFLGQTIVTEDLNDNDLRTHLRAPHLAWANDKLYLAYSIEGDSPKIWVKEYKI